jgi:hypothetical protein
MREYCKSRPVQSGLKGEYERRNETRLDWSSYISIHLIHADWLCDSGVILGIERQAMNDKHTKGDIGTTHDDPCNLRTKEGLRIGETYLESDTDVAVSKANAARLCAGWNLLNQVDAGQVATIESSELARLRECEKALGELCGAAKMAYYKSSTADQSVKFQAVNEALSKARRALGKEGG